jgi:hypothetical protein
MKQEAKRPVLKIEPQQLRKIKRIFRSQQIRQLARASGFEQRRSPINGSLFVLMVTIAALACSRSIDLESLLAAVGLECSRSALHQRFGVESVRFLWWVLAWVIQQV